MDVVRTKGAGVLLRHCPSGQVLSHADNRPVGFPDRATADNFRVRFLDENEAWEAVVSGAACRAA